MQQFWYQNESDYNLHVRQMLAAGWTMAHWQVNDDGTMSATWQPPAHPVVAPPRQTTVGIYDTEDQFRRDMARMTGLGWRVESVATTQNGRSLGGMLAFGLLARQRIRYTVVYAR